VSWLRTPFFCNTRRDRECLSTQSALNLDRAKDLGSNDYDYDSCKDNNPNNVALFYHLIGNAVGHCQQKCSIRPSLQLFPTPRLQSTKRKIIADG
jgi:hypothetical protein